MYINKDEHFKVDADLFNYYLTKETLLLKKWFLQNTFNTENLQAGSEIEFLLLNKEYQPIAKNLSFIKQLKDPMVEAESGVSQLEMNTKPLFLGEHFLTELHENILNSWSKCCSLAHHRGEHLLLIGSMPQADPSWSDYSCITPLNDFYLMNDYTTHYRKGFPLHIDIQGNEHLVLQPKSLAIEGLICSFQLHLAVCQSQASTYYNAIQILSAPLLALSSNAPFFYGKQIWSESRIAIFEQLYHFPLLAQKTVFFEPHYLKQSLLPLFEHNISDYPYLVPIVNYNEPEERMVHVRRQNGCLFRWNRPILDFTEQLQPYLRIEHRCLSSGPTIVDMIANAAFFYGIVYYFSTQSPPNPPINLKQAIINFYKAAQGGLNARLIWNGVSVSAHTLLKHLLPFAAKGLFLLGINQKEINYYLQIIDSRLCNKQNGSIWQQAYIAQHGKNFPDMLEQYLKYQYAEIPVSEWRVNQL